MKNKSTDTQEPSKASAKAMNQTKAQAGATPKTPASAPPSKINSVLALLKRPSGATLAELVQATGWLPHTTRAALTGLKKKGHDVERTKVDDVSRYSLNAEASK
jgi:hypothetical protein